MCNVRDNIDSAITDKQYENYKMARSRCRSEECNSSINNENRNYASAESNWKIKGAKKKEEGFVISSCEVDKDSYRDYDYYNDRNNVLRNGFRNRNRYGDYSNEWGDYSSELNEKSRSYDSNLRDSDRYGSNSRDKYSGNVSGRYKRKSKNNDINYNRKNIRNNDVNNSISNGVINNNRNSGNGNINNNRNIGSDNINDRNGMGNNRYNIKGKCVAVIIFIAIYLLIPTVFTLKVTGVVDNVVSEEITDGRTVKVSFKNATQTVDVEKYVAMVLAERLYMGDEVELLKAESIMIRTDIYRMMGEQMDIDSEQLGMSYLTTSHMKKKWGKDYEDKYNLISDCVAATKGVVIRFNDKYIDARYTYVTSGATLSGSDILGEGYEYLIVVDCPKDKESQEYLVVKTVSAKDFANAFEKMYDGLNINRKELDKQVQTVSADKNGYVYKMQVGNIVMTGSTFARILGLNSPNYKLEYMDSGVKVTTTGVGDGLGVSVYTAQSMATEGASYEDILKTFYNGVSVGE